MSKTIRGVIKKIHCDEDPWEPEQEHNITIQIRDVRDSKNKRTLSEKKLNSVTLPCKYDISFSPKEGDEGELFGFELQVRIETENELSYMNVHNPSIIEDDRVKDILDVDVQYVKDKKLSSLTYKK
jgi:hypothetical protein